MEISFRFVQDLGYVATVRGTIFEAAGAFKNAGVGFISPRDEARYRLRTVFDNEPGYTGASLLMVDGRVPILVRSSKFSNPNEAQKAYCSSGGITSMKAYSTNLKDYEELYALSQAKKHQAPFERLAIALEFTGDPVHNLSKDLNALEFLLGEDTNLFLKAQSIGWKQISIVLPKTRHSSSATSHFPVAVHGGLGNLAFSADKIGYADSNFRAVLRRE